MSYHGPTPTKFGRPLSVVESARLDTVHLYKGEPLKPVTHPLPFAALDQEDLLAQGIDTSKLVPGAQKVDALGSCTCNSGTTSLAAEWMRVRGTLPPGLSRTNLVQNEEYAIRLYHAVTDQTGDPSTEWPPTDCGSTGLYVCQELEHQKLIAGHKAATSPQALISLLQTGTVNEGKPFFNAWMEPDGDGIIDGNGTVFDFERAIASGVAGGHETCINAIDTALWKVSETGTVEQALLDERNSWDQAWGVRGNYKIHLTTLGYLQSYADWKQFVVAPA